MLQFFQHIGKNSLLLQFFLDKNIIILWERRNKLKLIRLYFAQTIFMLTKILNYNK